MIYRRKNWTWVCVLSGPFYIISGIVETLTLGLVFMDLNYRLTMYRLEHAPVHTPTEEEKEAEKKRALRFFSNQIMDQFIMGGNDDNPD